MRSMRARLPVHRAGWGPKNESAGPLRVQTGLKKMIGPAQVLALFGVEGKKQTGDCRWESTLRLESDTSRQNLPPLNRHHEKRKRRPNKTPPRGIFRPHHGREPTTNQPLDTAHLHKVEAPPVCHVPCESASPDPSHAKERQRHTLLQTGYHSSARHRHSLPVLKLVYPWAK